jgi:hypothetical protein
MTAHLDFDRFIVKIPEATEPEISVAVLKTPFRIAPVGEETDINFYLCSRDSGWWLVDPELAESGHIHGLYLAKLYLAMRPDGGLTLIPVTFPNPGFPTSWFDAWQSIIPAARRMWLRIVANKTAGRHEYEPVLGLPAPKWPENLSYKECVALAFRERILSVDTMPVSAEMPRRRTVLPGQNRSL